MSCARSLRGQLVRASMLTTFIALIVSAGALLAYELSTYRDSWVADIRTQAELIARSTEAALVFDDPKVAQATLTALRLQSRLRSAVVYDASGRWFARYFSSTDEPRPGPDDIAPTRYGPHFSGATLELVVPILHDQVRVGTLYLRAQHDIGPRVRDYTAILGLVTLLSLAISYVVFDRLLRRVTTPLVRMTEVAQQVMASRNWTLRAPETEYQELAVLVGAFNGMLAECQARTSELETEMGERERAEQGLRLADRRKDEFLATLAHELRNPLAPMSNALALLQVTGASLPVREHALVILERQMRHMVRLVDDLLDVARVTTGKLALHCQPLDVAVLLRQAIEIALPVAAGQRLALALTILPDGGAIPVDGDPARLAQVFSNLLNNACRYTEPGGRIDVVARIDGRMAEVSFSDTGIGIDPALQGRIFELFEQVDKSLGRGSAGLGIGLTLARQLVHLHGGDIAVSSAGVGHGARFTVRLPLGPPVPNVPPVPSATSVPPITLITPAPGPPAARSGAHRILLADDNVDFTSSLAELLQATGHEVTVANDGATALRVARTLQPDIALLDIGMPGLDGYELAHRLRADPLTCMTRLVAITGWGQAADREAATRAGFDCHLVKPVEPQALVAVLADLSTGLR